MNKKIKKVILSTSAYFIFSYAIAIDNTPLLEADKAYRYQDMKTLIKLVYNNYKDPTINYLLAKSMLNNDKIKYAEDYIKNMPDNYMKNDLIHQLLIFYYNKHDYVRYKTIYKKIKNSQINQNEACGFELATFKSNNQVTPTINRSDLIRNQTPIWCTDLVIFEFKSNNINQAGLDLMLYNLIATGKPILFNQAVSEIKSMKKLNFARFSSIPTYKLPQNRFLIVNRITQVAKKILN